MKIKLIAIVVLALLLCAMVPTAVTAAPAAKPEPKPLKVTVSIASSNGKKVIANGANIELKGTGKMLTFTASESGYWVIKYPSGMEIIPFNPSTSIGLSADALGTYSVSFGSASTYASWSAMVTVL